MLADSSPEIYLASGSDEYEQYFKYDEEAASGLDELNLSSSLSNRGDIKAKSDRGK